MINKIVVRLAMALMMLSLFSCNNDDDNYISVDDILMQEGYVKGTLVGLSADSVDVDESINLVYSYAGDNTMEKSNYNDSTFSFSVEYVSGITQKNYSCFIDFDIDMEDGVAVLNNFDLYMTKVLSESQILKISSYDYDGLVVENFSYDTNLHKISGTIVGTIEDRYYDSYQPVAYEFDVDLEFDVKVREEVR